MIMQNYYFTFGSSPLYPFGRDDYVMVTAPDMRTAVEIFQKHHPNRPGSNLVNCSDWYTEDAFNAFRDKFYSGRGPIEILTGR